MTESTKYRLITLFFTFLVFVGSLALLWYHAAPSVSFHDSGQFVVAAATGGLPHPPGAPSWTIGATLFLKIFSFNDPAYGCNLYAGMWGAITLALLYFLSARLMRRYFLPHDPWLAFISALLPPAILLGGSAFIEQSLIVEQYTMLIALMTVLVILFTWIPDWRVIPASLTRRLGVIAVVMGLTWGLALANHMSQVCLILPVGCYLLIILYHTNLKTTLGFSGLLLIGFVSGCLPFLYLPYVAQKTPPLDWVDAHSFERFMNAIQRKLWTRRPASEAPDHFIREWFYTYDIIGELGFVGFMLCLAGIALAIRKRWLPALWFTLMAFPFCAGLLYGHLTQSGMDIKYIRYYGVKDWHLPLYLWGAFMAIPAAGYLMARFPKTRLALPVIAALVVSQSVWAVHKSSLRDWNVPRQYIEDLKSGLDNPEGNFLLLGDDNKSYTMVYDTILANAGKNHFLYSFAYSPPEFPEDTDMAVFARQLVENTAANHQPVRVDDSVFNSFPASVYVDFQTEDRPLSKAILPAGFVYKLADNARVTSEAVILAEMKWREKNSHRLRLPGDNPHRLDREAYSILYWQRGIFFLQHGLDELAIEELKRALHWTPDNGFCWLALGLAFERLNATENRLQARLAYESAIESMEFLDEAYFRLGTLLVNDSKIEEGISHLEKCLQLNPGHTDAKLNLNYARSLLEN